MAFGVCFHLILKLFFNDITEVTWTPIENLTNALYFILTIVTPSLPWVSQ